MNKYVGMKIIFLYFPIIDGYKMAVCVFTSRYLATSKFSSKYKVIIKCDITKKK